MRRAIPRSTQVHLLNGWQLAYAADEVSLTFNGIVGPERPVNDRNLRALIDTVAVWRCDPRPRYVIKEPGVGYQLCEEG